MEDIVLIVGVFLNWIKALDRIYRDALSRCRLQGADHRHLHQKCGIWDLRYHRTVRLFTAHIKINHIDLPVYFRGGADVHLLPHDPMDETKRHPCIDAGNGEVAPATDYDDNPRKDDPQTPKTGAGDPGYSDMKAFEYQP